MEWYVNFPSLPGNFQLNEEKTRSDPDTFLVFPLMTPDQMRSQLGLLLEVSQYIPGLPKQNEEQTRNATRNLLVPMD